MDGWVWFGLESGGRRKILRWIGRVRAAEMQILKKLVKNVFTTYSVDLQIFYVLRIHQANKVIRERDIEKTH